jgi:predicted RNA binding protein YcfA (HicA-like mRNA interferase family)
MPRVPTLDYRTMDRVLRSLGFVVTRQRGSHVFYRRSDGRTTTVPNHGGRDLARPLVREILREIELSQDELVKVLDQL